MGGEGQRGKGRASFECRCELAHCEGTLRDCGLAGDANFSRWDGAARVDERRGRLFASGGLVGGTVGRVCQSQLPNCRVMSSGKAEGSILRRWQNVGSTTTVMKRRQTTGSSAYRANLSAFARLRSTLYQ